MSDRSQWTLYICIATFFVVIGIAALVLWRGRRWWRSDTEVILDALDGTRDQIDNHAKHTVLEHESLSKQLGKANGRLQFLMAREIAEELGEIAAAVAPKDGEPNADGMPPVYDKARK